MVNGYMPTSLAEALQIRHDYNVTPYGGGTDLMIEADETATYEFLNKVPEMKQIVEDDQYIRIGGSCTFTEVMRCPLVPELMRLAVSQIAAPAIRNGGTMAGNIGNGSAKADSVLIEYVADAKLRLASVAGERIVSILDFYKGRKQLDLHDDELIVEILLPKTGLENYTYKKVGARKALAISRIAFAGVITVTDNVITHLAVAFGAVENTIIRHKEIEAMLIGKTMEEAKALKQEFMAAFEEAIQPNRGRVSIEYRKTVCLNLLADFLTEKGI